jgi:hypothetical protein
MAVKSFIGLACQFIEKKFTSRFEIRERAATALKL